MEEIYNLQCIPKD